MTTAARQQRWMWNNPSKCSGCESVISGKGSTGMCRACWRRRRTQVSVTDCLMCKQNIPQIKPRYQYVRVAGGGREGRHNQRKIIATVCERCWKGKASVTSDA